MGNGFTNASSVNFNPPMHRLSNSTMDVTTRDPVDAVHPQLDVVLPDLVRIALFDPDDAVVFVVLRLRTVIKVQSTRGGRRTRTRSRNAITVVLRVEKYVLKLVGLQVREERVKNQRPISKETPGYTWILTQRAKEVLKCCLMCFEDIYAS